MTGHKDPAPRCPSSFVPFAVQLAAWFVWLLLAGWSAGAFASAVTGLGSVDAAGEPRQIAAATAITLTALALAGFLGTAVVSVRSCIQASPLGPMTAALFFQLFLAILWLSSGTMSFLGAAGWAAPRWLMAAFAVFVGHLIARRSRALSLMGGRPNTTARLEHHLGDD